MKNLILAFTLAAASLSAQVTVTVSPGNPSSGKLTVPIKMFPTFSAHVDGQNDRTGTWSVSASGAGTPHLIGNTVCTDGITSDCTIAVYDTTVETDTVTFTTTTSAVTGTGAVVFTAIPTPSTVHPRLWITPSTVGALQTYCASGGIIPTAFMSEANTLAASDDTAWNPSSGGGGYTGVVGSWAGGGTGLPNSTYIAGSLVNNSKFPELTAMIYALMANCDPTSGNRPQWAVRAHDQYIMNMKEILGTLPGEVPSTCNCLGNPHYLLGNRGSVWGVGVALVMDWVYSTFTPTDWSTEIQPGLIQMQAWANTNAGAIATSTPVPLGVYNNPSLFNTGSSDAYGYMRSFANNYGLFYSAMEIAEGIAIDAAQDPNTAHCSGGFDTVCTDGTPNSVRAGYHYGLGAWMYLQNANFEDPAVVVAEYNQVFGSTLTVNDPCTSNYYSNPSPITATMPCYGNERGGLSHEGSLYMLWLLHYANVAMLLQTSGNMDATNYPQLSFFFSSAWDETVQGYLHLTVPALYVNGQTFQNLFAYGPNNQIYDVINLLANTPISLYDLDKTMGRNDSRVNAEGWLMGNLDPEYSITTNIQGNLPAAMNMLLTELPGSTPFSSFTDPRSTMSPWFFSFNAGNLITSSGSWSSTTGGVFRHYCPRFPQPNHEEGYCGTFDFYLDGDWVTKGIYSYAFNDNTGYWTGESPDTANNMGLGNSSPIALPNPNPNEYIVNQLANRGGQFNNGYPTGQDTNDDYADSPTYTSDHLDSTGSRNWYGAVPGVGSGSETAVTAATTDYVWIKPHFIFAYDRGNLSTASFMRRWFMATGAVTVSGTHLSWPSSLNKTSNYMDVLLQASTNIAVVPVFQFGEYASGDYTVPTGSELLIDSNPINTASEPHTATNCGSSVCPTHQATYIATQSVTGGVSCGTLTMVSQLLVAPPPSSCDYILNADGSFDFNAADLTAGVTLHYTYSSTASSFRSLNVIQGQTFGTGATSVTLVQSTSGQGFDCGLESTNLVCFMRNLATFTGVTYPASGATTDYVGPLTPNTVYTLTGAGTPSTVKTDNEGTAVFAATGTGNITIGASTPPFSFTINGGTWHSGTTH